MISDNLASNNDRVCIGLKKKFVRFISPLAAKNDGFNNLNNRYSPNVLLNNNGEDEGGYNHFELRHYERPYTLPGIFNKGEINPPMQRLREWINGGYKIDSNN